MFTLEYREHSPNSESLYEVGNGDEGNIIYGVRSILGASVISVVEK